MLAKKLNIKPSSVANWSGGSIPGEEMQRKIAKEFGVSTEDVANMFKQTAPAGIDPKPIELYSFVPVLGSVCADRFDFSLDAIAEEQIPNPYPGKKIFALRVSGDCMEPTIHDGDYLYMSQTQPVGEGKVVLAQIDGQFTLKRYFRKADGIELRPDNPKYKTIKSSSNKLQIIAVAVGKYGKL